MGPINNILNRIDACNDQTARPIKNAICSRATNLFVSFPTEVAAVAQNILLTPFHAAGAVLKTGARIVNLVTGSQAVKNFEAKLPGFTDLLRTVTRIVAYAIGTALTLTLGVISPKANFNAHCALGLTINLRKEAVLAALAEVQTEDVLKKEEEEEELDAQPDADIATQDDLYAKEQEALDNLATAFKLAEQIETNVEESAEAAITAIKHVVEGTADSVKTSVEATIAAVEETIDEPKYDLEENKELTLKDEIDLDDEIDSEEDFIYKYEGELSETVAGKVLASTVSTTKVLASNIYHVITNPEKSIKNAYNYATSFFVKQAA